VPKDFQQFYGKILGATTLSIMTYFILAEVPEAIFLVMCDPSMNDL
jgi:hypothetical protein